MRSTFLAKTIMTTAILNHIISNSTPALVFLFFDNTVRHMRMRVVFEKDKERVQEKKKKKKRFQEKKIKSVPTRLRSRVLLKFVQVKNG